MSGLFGRLFSSTGHGRALFEGRIGSIAFGAKCGSWVVARSAVFAFFGGSFSGGSFVGFLGGTLGSLFSHCLFLGHR